MSTRRLLLSPLMLLVALLTVLAGGTVSASAGHGPETRVRAIPSAAVDAVGHHSGETAGDVGCLRPPKPAIVSGSCVATEAAGAAEGGGLQIAEGNAGHIFRDAAGHLAEDTAANRAIIQSAADNGVLVRTSPQGVQTFRQLLPDGTEAWAEVYQGQITNGGVNVTPRSP